MSQSPPLATRQNTRFVFETDEEPEFWQFLHGLRGDDLLVELIVNDLDARSARTSVSFEADRLVCVGRGRPVDDEGWARLQKIRGAGRKVPAKKGLFGIKNHGLKACFTLGNEIFVRSGGKQILQTLFADGPGRPASPGVRIPPTHDPEGPATGTMIEVPYRRTAFRAPYGEAFEFSARGEAQIDAMFLDAVANLPRRLLGVLRPLMFERYTLTLSHHRLGRANLDYTCGRWTISRGLMTFSRRCAVESDPGLPTQSAYERVAMTALDLADEVPRPEFYRATSYRDSRRKLAFGGKGLVLDVAWPTDKWGKLIIEAGRFRYPVAYPGAGTEALTGFGFSYSAPFASAAERHELGARSQAWNGRLIAACDGLVCRALSEAVTDKARVEALKLIANAPQDRLTTLVNKLLAARAMPAVDHAGRVVTIPKGALLVVPTYNWDLQTRSNALAVVTPAGSKILASRTPPSIVALLSGGTCEGWNETHLRFDELDVLDRMRRSAAEHFPWPSEAAWRKALSDAECAACHLDALAPYLTRGEPAARASSAGVMLPDASGTLRPFEALKRGIALPDALLDVDPPPVLHPVLKDHRVLKLGGWKLATYSFGDLLQTGVLAGLSLAARRRFFGWLTNHAQEVPRDDWTAVKALPIWLTKNGDARTLDQLCEPTGRLGTLLEDYIARPAREVRAFCARQKSGRVRLKVRSEPSAGEVAGFYRSRLGRFAAGGVLADAEREAFKAFEAELALFGAEGRSAGTLKLLAGEALALNSAGRLAPPASMVRDTLEIARLALPSEMVMVREIQSLDRIFPPLDHPTWQMAATALRRDPANTPALIPRLQVLVAGTSDPDLRRSVEDVPCIPVNGELLAPRDIAFKGNQGDFWGGWKTLIGARGLPDDVQELYRAVGVIRSLSEPRTSRAFFAWLSSQPQGVIADHVAQVLRHITHAKGASAWWLTPPEVPCIPVESASGVALLTLSDAIRQSFIEDFPTLADEIRQASPPFVVNLAIHSAPHASAPILDELRNIGVPALKASAKGPLSARVTHEQVAPADFLALLQKLRAESSARRLRKQLGELDVPLSMLEGRWQNKLAAIRSVRVGSDLRADYRLARRVFSPRVGWAVVAAREELWLNSDGDLEGAFYGAIADLIFTVPRPRYMPAVLRNALGAEVRDFQRQNDAPAPEPDQDLDLDLDPDHQDVGESVHPHPGGVPDPILNKPNPGPIHPGGSGKVRKHNRPKSSGRPQVVDEDIQRHQLKANHYAWHCQIDLATAGPATLAPAGSYVEHQENRQKIMEAHHPDKASVGGPRNAGNLLILSHLNHDRYGRAISRQQVTEALAKDCTPRVILSADGEPWVKGVVAQILIPATGEFVDIFFTHDHRKYWLEMAKENPTSPEPLGP